MSLVHPLHDEDLPAEKCDTAFYLIGPIVERPTLVGFRLGRNPYTPLASGKRSFEKESAIRPADGGSRLWESWTVAQAGHGHTIYKTTDQEKQLEIPQAKQRIF